MDCQLLPALEAVLVTAGLRVRVGNELTVPLAHANALEGDQRLVQEPAELLQAWPDSISRADCDDYRRHVRVSAEETATVAALAAGAVDAVQHACRSDSVALENVTYRGGRRRVRRPLLTPQVDRDPRDLIGLLGELDRCDLAGEKLRWLER